MDNMSVERTAVVANAAPAPLLEHAERLGEAGAYGEALQVLDRALVHHPDDARVHAARGWVIENIEPVRLDEARCAYQTAVALDPDELWAGVGLATVLGRLGQAGRSEAIYRELVEQVAPRTANAPELLELLGWCLYRLGRFDEAAETFRRALAIDADWVSVRFDLGLVLLQRGDADAAAAQAQRALHSLDGRPAKARAAALRLALEDLDDAMHLNPGTASTRLRAQLVNALVLCHA